MSVWPVPGRCSSRVKLTLNKLTPKPRWLLNVDFVMSSALLVCPSVRVCVSPSVVGLPLRVLGLVLLL